MQLPKGLSSVKMLAENCPKCMRMRREVKRFKLDFDPNLVNESMAEVLPDEDNTSGTFCVFVGCDLNFKTLLDSTYNLPNKRTFEDAHNLNKNGVP